MVPFIFVTLMRLLLRDFLHDTVLVSPPMHHSQHVSTSSAPHSHSSHTLTLHSECHRVQQDLAWLKPVCSSVLQISIACSVHVALMMEPCVDVFNFFPNIPHLPLCFVVEIWFQLPLLHEWIQLRSSQFSLSSPHSSSCSSEVLLNGTEVLVHVLWEQRLKNFLSSSQNWFHLEFLHDKLKEL